MLKKIIFLSTFMIIFYLSKAQSFVQNAEVGVFFGTSYYIGDLNEKHFNLTQPAIGLMYRWNLNRRFALKGSVWTGSIRGSDKTSNDSVRINRNLHFKSPLTELSGQIEFNFFEYETGSNRYKFSPFIFTGISFMTFNPQARRYDTDNLFDDDGVGTNNEWVDLQPLGTEGQFSDQYPEKEPYTLTQFTVPLGIGLKLSMGEKLSIIAEYGIRKTFTDYLDDVGGTYANPIHLLSDPNNGQIAATFSDRSLDFYLWALDNYGAQSPEEAEQYIAMWNGNYDNQTQTGNLRSNPNEWNDWYVFSGLTISYKIIKKSKVCLF